MSAVLIYFFAPPCSGKTVASRAMFERLATDRKSVKLLDDIPLCMAHERRRALAEIEKARARFAFVIVTSSHPCAAQWLPTPHFVFHPVDGRKAGRQLWCDRKPEKKGGK